MKKYNITVNGNTYDVEVEEIGAAVAAPTPTPISSKPVEAAPSATQAPKAALSAASAAAPTAGAQTIECPMPGTILDIKVKAGDAVKQGQVLLILEAMKMENEITASGAGTVDTVQVTKGASVNAGDVLISIK